MNDRLRKTVLASMLAALCCVATMIIKIPSPFKGYLNLGDCIVLLSGWVLSPLYGFFAAGIGSAMADVMSGYIIYAPATFLIKGAMALICHITCKHRDGKNVMRLAGGILAEIVMVAGYFVFEGFLYGFGTSAVNIPANGIQGAVGVILGILLLKVFEKSRIID